MNMNDRTNALNPDELEQVTGGFVLADKAKGKYCVVRQDGNILAPAPSLEKAIEYAKSYNVSQTVLTPDDYKKRYARDPEW